MIVIVPEAAAAANINRLTNQMWKLIPMRANNENWQSQIDSILVELLGLKDIYYIADEKFVILFSKLKGLKNDEITFEIYRNTVFKCISILRGMRL
jgi:hypothetical protein